MFATKYVVAIPLLLLSGCAEAQPDLRTAVQMSAKSTVQIQVKANKNDKTFQSLGTGWLWRDQNIVITAKHVIVPRPDPEEETIGRYAEIKVIFPDGKSAIANNIKVSNRNDIGMIFLNKDDLKDAKRSLLIIHDSNPELGEELCGIGFGLGIQYHAFFGRVSSTSNPNRFIMSAEINPGHSGAAVIDNNGRVIGIAISKMIGNAYEDPPYPVLGINHFIPAKTLSAELNRLLN
jgi:S1-C subfamily serine protease